MELSKATSVNSRAEELFVQLFCEAFGPEKTENLQVQYPCVDIYGRHRYIDFALESPESKIAIEIDGETYHNPSKVSENKYADDLLKQNSLIYDNWKVYRWIYSQLEKQPEKVKDELITFLGSSPMFKAFEADLPVQMGQTIELRDYQQEAIDNLKKMREDGKTIALLYHATGVGKTITAATDAKAVGGRTLFLCPEAGFTRLRTLLQKCGQRLHWGNIPEVRKMFRRLLFLPRCRASPRIWKNSPRQILII